MSLNKTELLLVAPQVGAQYIVPKTPLDSYSGFKVPSYSPCRLHQKVKISLYMDWLGTAVTRQGKGHFYVGRKEKFHLNLTWRGE